MNEESIVEREASYSKEMDRAGHSDIDLGPCCLGNIMGNTGNVFMCPAYRYPNDCFFTLPKDQAGCYHAFQGW